MALRVLPDILATSPTALALHVGAFTINLDIQLLNTLYPRLTDVTRSSHHTNTAYSHEHMYTPVLHAGLQVLYPEGDRIREYRSQLNQWVRELATAQERLTASGDSAVWVQRATSVVLLAAVYGRPQNNHWFALVYRPDTRALVHTAAFLEVVDDLVDSASVTATVTYVVPVESTVDEDRRAIQFPYTRARTWASDVFSRWILSVTTPSVQFLPVQPSTAEQALLGVEKAMGVADVLPHFVGTRGTDTRAPTSYVFYRAILRRILGVYESYGMRILPYFGDATAMAHVQEDVVNAMPAIVFALEQERAVLLHRGRPLDVDTMLEVLMAHAPSAPLLVMASAPVAARDGNVPESLVACVAAFLQNDPGHVVPAALTDIQALIGVWARTPLQTIEVLRRTETRLGSGGSGDISAVMKRYRDMIPSVVAQLDMDYLPASGRAWVAQKVSVAPAHAPPLPPLAPPPRVVSAAPTSRSLEAVVDDLYNRYRALELYTASRIGRDTEPPRFTYTEPSLATPATQLDAANEGRPPSPLLGVVPPNDAVAAQLDALAADIVKLRRNRKWQRPEWFVTWDVPKAPKGRRAARARGTTRSWQSQWLRKAATGIADYFPYVAYEDPMVRLLLLFLRNGATAATERLLSRLAATADMPYYMRELLGLLGEEATTEELPPLYVQDVLLLQTLLGLSLDAKRRDSHLASLVDSAKAGQGAAHRLLARASPGYWTLLLAIHLSDRGLVDHVLAVRANGNRDLLATMLADTTAPITTDLFNLRADPVAGDTVAAPLLEHAARVYGSLRLFDILDEMYVPLADEETRTSLRNRRSRSAYILRRLRRTLPDDVVAAWLEDPDFFASLAPLDIVAERPPIPQRAISNPGKQRAEAGINGVALLNRVEIIRRDVIADELGLPAELEDVQLDVHYERTLAIQTTAKREFRKLRAALKRALATTIATDRIGVPSLVELHTTSGFSDLWNVYLVFRLPAVYAEILELYITAADIAGASAVLMSPEERDEQLSVVLGDGILFEDARSVSLLEASEEENARHRVSLESVAMVLQSDNTAAKAALSTWERKLTPAVLAHLDAGTVAASALLNQRREDLDVSLATFLAPALAAVLPRLRWLLFNLMLPDTALYENDVQGTLVPALDSNATIAILGDLHSVLTGTPPDSDDFATQVVEGLVAMEGDHASFGINKELSQLEKDPGGFFLWLLMSLATRHTLTRTQLDLLDTYYGRQYRLLKAMDVGDTLFSRADFVERDGGDPMSTTPPPESVGIGDLAESYDGLVPQSDGVRRDRPPRLRRLRKLAIVVDGDAGSGEGGDGDDDDELMPDLEVSVSEDERTVESGGGGVAERRQDSAELAASIQQVRQQLAGRARDDRVHTMRIAPLEMRGTPARTYDVNQVIAQHTRVGKPIEAPAKNWYLPSECIAAWPFLANVGSTMVSFLEEYSTLLHALFYYTRGGVAAVNSVTFVAHHTPPLPGFNTTTDTRRFLQQESRRQYYGSLALGSMAFYERLFSQLRDSDDVPLRISQFDWQTANRIVFETAVSPNHDEVRAVVFHDNPLLSVRSLGVVNQRNRAATVSPEALDTQMTAWRDDQGAFVAMLAANKDRSSFGTSTSRKAVLALWRTRVVLTNWSHLSDALVRVFAGELHPALTTLTFNHVAAADDDADGNNDVWERLFAHMATRYETLLQHTTTRGFLPKGSPTAFIFEFVRVQRELRKAGANSDAMREYKGTPINELVLVYPTAPSDTSRVWAELKLLTSPTDGIDSVVIARHILSQALSAHLIIRHDTHDA